MSAEQARQIAALGDAGLLTRLDKVWGTVRKSPADRLRQIGQLKQKLETARKGEADLVNGRELFRKTCASCHKLFGEGRTIGPELTGANRRNLHYLVSNVVDPSAAVPADFRLATVVTHSGRVITGAITQRSEASLTIQTAEKTLQLAADGIESVTVSPKSMMPDGLLDKLSEDQTRDLFAWVMSDGVVPTESLTTTALTKELPVVILLGDSIRMNYQNVVVAELQGRATVWSPEENGQHTGFTLDNLEAWVKGRNAAVVHINVGLHDMFLSAKTDQPRHSLDVYTANLQAIFEKLMTLTDATIVFALTTPVDEERQAVSETYGRVVRRSEDIVRYNVAATKVARAAEVQINDLFTFSNKVGANKVLRQTDGIHLSDEGLERVGKHVADVIQRVLDKRERSEPRR